MRRHIALLLWSLALTAQAQSEPASADTVSHVLSDVVVTAQSASRSAVSTAPLRTVDQSQMLRRGVADVSDALHRMPGVNLRDYGGAGGLKTVSVRGFSASHTGVVIDGVPVSDVQSGQVDLSRYSVDNVDRVSMVIGDNDDIFIPARHAATAATVSISSAPVLDSRELNVKLRAGSYGYINPFVRVGTPLSEHAAVNVVGEFTHADNDYPFRLYNGTVTTTERRTNSRMNSGHVEANALWQPSARSSLTAKVYYFDTSRRLPGPVIYYTNVSHERLREQNAMAQARLRSSLSSTLSVSAVLKYNYAVSLYHDENGKYPGGVLDQNYWQREYYASGALLWAPRANWAFDYSTDYFFNNLNSNLATDSRPRRNSLLQSATAKLRTRRLTVMARMLYSLYLNGAKRGTAAADASRLSPSVSASWQPWAGELLYVRASYKNIFRMPTFNEAYFDHYGSTDVRPETTDQVNVGATYTFKSGGIVPMVTVALDGYVNEVRDMIVAVPYNMFVWTMINLAKARTVGADLTAEAIIAPAKGHAINIAASYSLQRAMPRTSRESSEWMKQVAYIPKHSGSASVSYENPWVCISVSGQGVSERFTTNANLPATRIPGYVEVGLTAWRDFSLGRHQLQLRADVINALNKQYSVVARYPMPGRQLRFTVSYKL